VIDAEHPIKRCALGSIFRSQANHAEKIPLPVGASQELYLRSDDTERIDRDGLSGNLKQIVLEIDRCAIRKKSFWTLMET